MATYCISDIHGEYDAFMKMLKKINFSGEDTLYILGDILDRGKHPIKTLLEIMNYPNMICIVGNHDMMALRCMNFLMQEITEENIEQLDENTISAFVNWQSNGGGTTLKEFKRLNVYERNLVVEFIKNFSVYEETQVNDRKYVMVHAGLGNFDPQRPLNEYSLHELIWERTDYDTPYYSDKYVVTGHTPTRNIKGNPKPDYIYKANNHIAIDCGACFGGNLGAVCLDTLEEFYV